MRKSWTEEDWNRIDITDHYMFGTVMRDPEIFRDVVEAATGRYVGDVHEPTAEMTIDEPGPWHGERADVLALAESGVWYDAEMQRNPVTDIGKRVRNYHAGIAIKLLKRGEDYVKLPGVTVVFVCLFDPFDAGLPRYSFGSFCRERKDIELKDGAETVFVCANHAEAAQDPALRELLDYINTGIVTGELSRRLEEEVRETRSNVRWREQRMSWEAALADARYEARQEGLEEGRQEDRLELWRLLQDAGVDAVVEKLEEAGSQVRSQEGEHEGVVPHVFDSSGQRV